MALGYWVKHPYIEECYNNNSSSQLLLATVTITTTHCIFTTTASSSSSSGSSSSSSSSSSSTTTSTTTTTTTTPQTLGADILLIFLFTEKVCITLKCGGLFLPYTLLEFYIKESVICNLKGAGPGRY